MARIFLLNNFFFTSPIVIFIYSLFIWTLITATARGVVPVTSLIYDVTGCIIQTKQSYSAVCQLDPFSSEKLFISGRRPRGGSPFFLLFDYLINEGVVCCHVPTGKTIWLRHIYHHHHLVCIMGRIPTTRKRYIWWRGGDWVERGGWWRVASASSWWAFFSGGLS